jgi:hypothetical protein
MTPLVNPCGGILEASDSADFPDFSENLKRPTQGNYPVSFPDSEPSGTRSKDNETTLPRSCSTPPRHCIERAARRLGQQTQPDPSLSSVVAHSLGNIVIFFSLIRLLNGFPNRCPTDHSRLVAVSGFMW